MLMRLEGTAKTMFRVIWSQYGRICYKGKLSQQGLWNVESQVTF